MCALRALRERVMESVECLLAQRLKLHINKAKSAVAPPQQRKFLGFSFTRGAAVKRRIAPRAVARFKERVRMLTAQT
jgi:RNA-directed DNA polymerase